MATPDHDQRCLLVDGMTTSGRPAMTASLLRNYPSFCHDHAGPAPVGSS